MFRMLGCCIKHNQYIYGNFVKLGDWGWEELMTAR